MKKLALAFAIALSLAGCASLQNANTAFDLATRSVQNPVSKNDLYRIEAGISIAFTALNTYKKACAQGIADTNCRSNIAAIQVYTRQVPPYLRQLRVFVKTNDQVNAVVVYNQLSGILSIIRSEAAARGIQTGA